MSENFTYLILRRGISKKEAKPTLMRVLGERTIEFIDALPKVIGQHTRHVLFGSHHMDNVAILLKALIDG